MCKNLTHRSATLFQMKHRNYYINRIHNVCYFRKVLKRGPLEARKSHEPRHDKTNKVSVHPAKTLIRLGIQSDQSHPVWSESSLCAQWVAKAPSFLHADSEDPDQTRRMPRLIWVFAGRTLILLVLSCRGSHKIFIYQSGFIESYHKTQW